MVRRIHEGFGDDDVAFTGGERPRPVERLLGGPTGLGTSQARLVAAKRPQAAEPAAPGRSRLLYPVHWQSPYPQGNRYTDLLERGTIEWLTRFGLITTPEDAQTIQEFECGLYGGLSSPASNLRDGLILTEFVSLWLYFDDRVIEDSEAWSLEDPVAFTGTQPAFKGPSGFLNAWNDLCDRMRRTQSEEWMTRLGESLKAWIGNAKRETENARVYQQSGALPPFETMLDIRTVSIGMYPTFYLIEMAEGWELPRSVHESEAIRDLKRLASRLVGYGNDVGGLAKDLAGRWPNLVVALKEERGLSLEEAFDQVTRMHNREVEAFDAAACRLPTWGPDLDAQVRGFVQAVRHSVLGFTLWESLATRYQKWTALAGPGALTAPVTLFTPPGVKDRSIPS
jgi:hypothetical protein